MIMKRFFELFWFLVNVYKNNKLDNIDFPETITVTIEIFIISCYTIIASWFAVLDCQKPEFFKLI